MSRVLFRNVNHRVKRRMRTTTTFVEHCPPTNRDRITLLPLGDFDPSPLGDKAAITVEAAGFAKFVLGVEVLCDSIRGEQTCAK